jgi:hypothetical protein
VGFRAGLDADAREKILCLCRRSNLLNINLHLLLDLPSGLSLSFFPTKLLYASFCSLRFACSAHFIRLDIIALKIFNEEHKL